MLRAGAPFSLERLYILDHTVMKYVRGLKYRGSASHWVTRG
jgi:hypothetical protein